jgi:hypothetical protein
MLTLARGRQIDLIQHQEIGDFDLLLQHLMFGRM